jgi:hypothetical protein
MHFSKLLHFFYWSIDLSHPSRWKPDHPDLFLYFVGNCNSDSTSEMKQLQRCVTSGRKVSQMSSVCQSYNWLATSVVCVIKYTAGCKVELLLAIRCASVCRMLLSRDVEVTCAAMIMNELGIMSRKWPIWIPLLDLRPKSHSGRN